MPPGTGGSTSGTITRRSRRISRPSREKINPGNVEFGRQVAAIETRQQEQERMSHMSHFSIYLPYYYILQDESIQDEYQVLPNGHQHSASLRPYNGAGTLGSSEPKQASHSDFLEGTFLKIGSDKQKAKRNKNSSKNKKKKKGKCRKQSDHASEMQNELRTEPSSACANAVSDEAMPLEYSSSSSSSQVTELVSPIYTASSGNEKEEQSSSNGLRNFSTSYCSVAGSSVNDSYSGSKASLSDSYTGSKAWNKTMGDHAGSLSDARSEWSLSVTELTDSRGFNKWGGDRNKPNDHKSFSIAISSGTSQEGSLRGDDASHDGEFQKVVSRKTAQKMKKMQHLQSLSALVPRAPRAPCEITIGHYITNDCFSGRKPNHKKDKYQKAPSLSEVKKTGFADEENVPGSSRMLLITVHPGNLESSQMEISSTSRHHVALEVIEESCSSECLPLQEELKALAPADEDTKETDSRAASNSDKTSSLDQVIEESCSSECLPLQGELAPADDDAKDTDSRAASSDKTSSLDHRVNPLCVDREEQKKEENEQVFSSHESELDKIIKAVNNAYEIEAVSRMYMTCGNPVADIETFLQSATPVIGQIPRTTSNICLQGQLVRNQPYPGQMPSIALRSVWKWYEEPGVYGIEVKIQGRMSSPTRGTYSMSELCAYFVPSLSAVQLFGQASFSSSPSPGGLLFEYFEREIPFSRPPLFTKIKELVSGVNMPDQPIFGDPRQLESVKLSDLHPASWFCVAWYPIYQIPSAAGNSKAAFLTYHSLGMDLQTCSTKVDDSHTPIICQVVGLLSYKGEGEKWFKLAEQQGSKPTPEGSLETDPTQLLNERLRTLRHGASAMSKAVVTRETGEAMNYHPDYNFFWSQPLY